MSKQLRTNYLQPPSNERASLDIGGPSSETKREVRDPREIEQEAAYKLRWSVGQPQSGSYKAQPHGVSPMKLP